MAKRRTPLLCCVWTCMLFVTNVDGQNWWQAEPIDRNVHWTPDNGPHRIEESLWFLGPQIGSPHSGATLTIDPGTEVRFGPGVMLAFNGTLLARGTPENPIIFTKLEDPSVEVPQWPQDIRLVDDRSVAYGRLQLNYRGRWRGICANFQNWTKDDTDVACRQLGFQWGNFSFFSWARNDSLFMLYHKPECTGVESSLLDCARVSQIEIGARVCEGQQTVHLHCYGLAPNNPAKDFWWGLEFYNSTNVPTSDGTHFINESSSIMQNVIIKYAGVDRYGSAVPALRASPHAPHLINVTIQHSALDAVNYTEIRGSTVIRNSVFENNRGHGFVAETHLGRMTITDSLMQGNVGDGMRAKFLDGRYPIFDERGTFCRRSNIRGGFPITISGFPSLSPPCDNWFETDTTERVTLNILEMDIEDEARGTLEVYNGRECAWSPLLERIPIVNGTFPRGITSTFHQMCVRFVWEQLPPICPTLQDCIKFTILLDSAPESIPELYMNNTRVLNNTQHGIFVENVRNYIYINSSDISHNQYGAGLRVFGGAGDVHVNSSTLNYNLDNGVNITYDGGLRIFNMSDFNHNYGNGINVTLNETRVDNKTRYSLSMFNTQGRDGPSRRIERTEVSNSNFQFNDGFGVRVANSCRAGMAVVNDSTFVQNRREAIEFESCFQLVPDANVTNFTVGYNLFDGNYGHAVLISPLINAVGRIANNTFQNHPRHVIRLDNTDDFLFNRYWTQMLVDFEVMGNEFFYNQGFYVINVRLTEGGLRQRMDVKYNVFKDNIIEGAFPTLNERTRAFAVAIISSSNVNFSRNHLHNVDSKFELATHLLDKSVIIEVTRQWWGTTNYTHIIERIFDQFSRFNLPKLEYHPVLRYPDLYGPWITDEQRPEEIKFNRGDTIGGRLSENFVTEPGKTYMVDRDISIISFGFLRISRGTTFNFANAIGMLVQDRLEADGTEAETITMKLLNETTILNSTFVRLVEGDTEMEGRLEVRPSEQDEWGTICDLGWSIIDASVVCQMLGMVVHPNDWRSYMNRPGPSYQPIWRSYVRCDELDMNVMECEADHENDHSCTHESDVYVRCKPPTWAGISFLATAASSRIRHATITGAGLMDPTAILYSPAIRIDYNIHTLEHLNIIDNMDDGLEILRNDVYANARITHSLVARNFGNGVSTRGSFFQVFMCTLQENERAGFEYNPHYTTYEAQQMRAGIRNPQMLNETKKTTQLANEAFVFWATPVKLAPESRTYELEVEVSSLHRVVMDILDYNPDTDQENITVFDGRASTIVPTTQSWTIEDDLVDFPVSSAGTFLTIRWRVTGTASGRFTFVLRSRPHDWRWPFAEIRVRNTTTVGNEFGVVTKHYNQPSNEYLDLFFRFRWETIQMYGVTFQKNRFEALHAPSLTKYHELYLPSFEELQNSHRLAEISYEIDNCLFEENGGGVLAEHNHVEFSNNIWIWMVTHNRFERNYEGGFKIELPRINLMFTELFNHSVDINDTIFENNENFEFRIDGFYCNSSIARNRFQGNECKLGCITIAGTEKDAEIFDNEIVENVGKYIMEINMNSHTPYNQWVEMTIQFNNFKRNRKLDNLPPPVASRPTSYTLGIKGLQNVTINRNLFGNSMDFELVGGMSSSLLENYLDVRECWWGSSDQVVIREYIFDFDDWNSYAIAEYYPYLLGNNFDSQVATGGRLEPILDLTQPFGGRIEQYTEFHARAEPYIVRSDLTVMPHTSILIHPGAEFQFFPSIGILVLGAMTARGTAGNKVKFSPVPISMHHTVGMMNSRNATATLPGGAGKKRRRRRRQIIKAKTDKLQDTDYQVRLNGGDHEYEGFIELYNATERRWSIVCDNQFHARTAEVACRTMGMVSTNVAVRRTRWYDHFVFGFPLMHEQKIEWFWRRSFICDGRETDLSQCRYRLNHHLRQCMEEREYVFVRCGPRNLATEYDYWGNIRFSTPEYESGSITPGGSFLQQADIYGAGILHEDYQAAVQAVHRVSESNYVRISHSANNGYDYIAPRGEFAVINNVIENNNGYAVTGLILTGESRYDVPQSSFTPLVESTIPYNVFGMVRMCTTEKLIWIQDRLLLYFKYNFQTVDCIKIIRSREPRKAIALRFLQLKMFNDSFFKNAVEMYNGEYFDHELLLGTITSESPREETNIMYRTSTYFDAMGIRITASAAHGYYGFIAEVVTLPLSPGWRPDLGPGIRQRIAQCTISGNEGGGFHFSNAGELNPSVVIEQNSVSRNGLRLLNMTSPPVIHMYIQNTRLLTVSNNYIQDNAGGVFLNTTTASLSNALFCNITNNIINYNTHGASLHLEGHHFQGISCRDNYIAHNDVEHRNVMAMFGVNLNFTSNIANNNTGQTIINATVPRQVSINQNYRANAIHDNWAFAMNRSTIFLGSAAHSFRDNFFLNRFNVYEMVTFNRTHYPDGTYPEVDARNNWWGGGNPAFVSGRIWERRDDDNLIGVVFEPAYTTNQTVLQGRCDPGWRLFEQRCFLYFGGVATYQHADQNCRRHRARLGWARDHHRERWLGEVVASAQENYDEFWMTWVFSENQRDGLCTVLLRNTISHIDCNAILPSICERDPYVSPVVDWHYIIIAVSVAGGLLLLFVPICICMGCMKARARKKQKIDRRATLRASIKASRASLFPQSGATQADEVRYQRRRRAPLNKSDPSTLDGITLDGVTLDETTDSTNKMQMKLNSLDSHRPSTPASTLDYSSSGKMDTSNYYDSDLGPVRHRHHEASGYQPPQLENEISHYRPRPQPTQFHHVYAPSAFDEKSVDRSHLVPDSPTRGYSSAASGYGGRAPSEGATGYGPRSGFSGSGLDTSGYGGASGYAHSGPGNTSSYSYGNPSFQGNLGVNSGDYNRGHQSTSSSKIDWDELHPPRARDERPPRPKPKESAM